MTTATRDRRRRRALIWLLGLLILLLAAPALGCPVCYGESEDQMIDGARYAVVFMLGLTYLLLGGGVFMVVATRRRLTIRREENHASAPRTP